MKECLSHRITEFIDFIDFRIKPNFTLLQKPIEIFFSFLFLRANCFWCIISTPFLLKNNNSSWEFEARYIGKQSERSELFIAISSSPGPR